MAMGTHLLTGKTDDRRPLARLRRAVDDVRSGLRDDVDAFFNDVMVMAEDVALRNNRLALLSILHRMMNRVADISKLAA